MVAHSIAHAAVIRFHYVETNAVIYSSQTIGGGNADGTQVAMESARRIISIAEYVVANNLKMIDPIIVVRSSAFTKEVVSYSDVLIHSRWRGGHPHNF